MSDITKVFLATVKSVKTRKKDLSALLQSHGSDNGNGTRITKEHDKFDKTARGLVSSIKELQAFLLQHQRDYLGGVGLTGIASFMTEEERDQIDQDAQTLMQSCLAAILHLKSEVNIKTTSDQLVNHREAVLDMINAFLKDVCKLYSQQRAIRVKSTVEHKRRSRLNPHADKTKDTPHHGDSLQTLSESKPFPSNRLSETPTYDLDSPKNLFLDEEKLEDPIQHFTPEETQMFERENEQLYEEMNHIMNEVRQIEGKVMEISQLQEIFSEKVLHQASQVDHIYDTAVATTENVKEGNENIREAIKNSATFRVWILFFLVMCTFSLLFLDWYNQ